MEVIRLIVSKAIDEPMYQCIYARLVSNALTTKPSHVASTIRENLIAYIHTLLQVRREQISCQELTNVNPNVLLAEAYN